MITVREFNKEDITEEYIMWLCDKKVNRYLSTKWADYDSCFRYYNSMKNGLNNVMLKIIHVENYKGNVKEKMIGTATIQHIDFVVGWGILGIMIGDHAFIGRGYGTEAIEVIKKYCFAEMGITTLKLGVLPGNQMAKNCFAKAGFKETRIEMEWSMRQRFK